MTNIEISEKPKKICVFLGSGFDRNIGMPTWTDLIHQYSSFLTGSIDISRSKGLKKIELIEKSNFSLVRKYSMLKSLEKEHTRTYQKNKFIENVFDISSYDLDNISALVEFVDVVKNMQNVRIVTTNISNTLIELGMKNVAKAADLDSSLSFFPVHGIIKDKNSSPVLSELDYLENSDAYNELLMNIEEYDEIHIYGYSLNDWRILNILRGVTMPNLYFYFLHDDENWKEIMKKHINEIFKRNNKQNTSFESIKTDWSIDNNNRLIKLLIENLKKHGVPFSDISSFEDAIENKYYNKLLNFDPNDVRSVVTSFCKKNQNNSQKISQFISELISFETTTSGNRSKIYALNELLNRIERDKLKDDLWKKINEYYKKMIRQKNIGIGDIGTGIIFNTNDVDLILMLFDIFKFPPIFHFRNKEEILSIIEKVEISKKIILGLLYGYSPFIYFEEESYNEPVDKKVYDCAFKAMNEAINDHDFLNGLVISVNTIEKIDTLIHNDSFYAPYALAAKNILHKNKKLEIMGGDYIYSMKEKNINIDGDYEKLHYLGDLAFTFYGERQKIIDSINKGNFRISDSLRNRLGIKTEDVKNQVIQNNSWYTITKDNFNTFDRLDLSKLDTKKTSIELINNDLEVANLRKLKYIIEIINDHKVLQDFSFDDFKEIKKKKSGAFLSFFSRYYPNKAKNFLRKDDFESLDLWSCHVIKPEEVLEIDIEKIIKVFNSLKEVINNEKIDYPKLTSTLKGAIFNMLFRSNVWKKEFINDFKPKDSFKWWIEGIKFTYGMDFIFPDEKNDIYTFINSCMETSNPFKEFFENKKIWEEFIKFISDLENKSNVSIDFVIAGIVWLPDEKSKQIIGAISSNEKYDLNGLVRSFLTKYNDKFKKKIKLILEDERIAKVAAKWLISNIILKPTNEIRETTPEWILRKLLLDSDYEIAPYEIHEVSHFLSKSKFSDEEKVKIISKITKSSTRKTLMEDHLGIDGITQLLDSVSQEKSQKILILLRKKFLTIPFKFLSRLKKI